MYNQLKDEVRTLVDEIFPEIISIKGDFSQASRTVRTRRKDGTDDLPVSQPMGNRVRDNIGATALWAG